jgi:hypothetical protein
MEQELEQLLFEALGKAGEVAGSEASQLTPLIASCYEAWQNYTAVMSDPAATDTAKQVAKGDVLTAIARLSLAVEDALREMAVRTVREVAILITGAVIKALARL